MLSGRAGPGSGASEASTHRYLEIQEYLYPEMHAGANDDLSDPLVASRSSDDDGNSSSSDDDGNSSSSDEDESDQPPSPIHPPSPGPIDDKKGDAVDYSKAPPIEFVLLSAVKLARAKGASEDTTVRLVEAIATIYREAVLPTRSANKSELPSEVVDVTEVADESLLHTVCVVALAAQVVASAAAEAAVSDDHRISTRNVEIRGQTVFDVPNDYEVVYKSRLSRLESQAVLGAAIEKATSGVGGKEERHNYSDRSRTHYASGLMEAPSLSLYAAEQAIPSFIAGWLTHHVIPFDPAVLATTCPSEKTLNDIVVDGTRDSILLLEEELADAVAIFIACDKGNRKGIAHFPKVLSWWSKKNNCVRSVCIDADGSGSTSDKCAKAIELSLKKFQNQTVVLRGQTTDSGGGGVLESLASALKDLNLTEEEYSVANCTLHALQMAFANPVKEIFGEGGLDRRNVMQLIHSCYDLQSCFEKTEREMKWEIANGTPPPEAISKAVLTRWWHVNTAAQHLKKNWEQWKLFAAGCLNATTADTAAGKISSSILSLMDESKIYCDLLFICAYSKAFFTPHMEWLQGHDAVAKDFGYRSRDMATRSYIIHRDLTTMQANWETMPEYHEFVEEAKKRFPSRPPPPPPADDPAPEPNRRSSSRSRILTERGEELQAQLDARRDAQMGGEGEEEGQSGEVDDAEEDVVTDEGFFRRCSDNYTYQDIKEEIDLFFSIALKMATKHFALWTGPLLPCGLAGEKQSAQALARLITGKEVDGTYHSETHGCSIDLADMAAFFRDTAKVNVEEVKKRKLVSDHWDAISNHMAEGEDLWSSTIPVMLAMRSDAENTIIPLASSTHRVEAQVRECSLVASTNRGEDRRSDYIFQRSSNTRAVNQEARSTRRGRRLHANGSMCGGVQGQRQTSSGGAEDPTKKQRERTRGEERIKIQLTSTEKRYSAIQRIPGILGKQKRMKNALVTKNDLKAQISRANREAEEFRRKYMISRAQNKRQKERGVDRTYLVVGRIPYKSLRAGVPDHMNFLHTELVHRRTDAADIPAGFRERIKMLKEMEKDNKSFRAQTQVNFEL